MVTKYTGSRKQHCSTDTPRSQVQGILFPLPSYQLRLHIMCTNQVARRHFWFGHVTTIVSVFASTSRILWSIDLRIGHDSMSNRMEQHQDSVVILSTSCRLVIQWSTPSCARFLDDVYVMSRTSFHLGLRKHDKIRHNICFFVIPSAN